MPTHKHPRAAGPADLRPQAIRGTAPRRTPGVRALAAYAEHADCPLATLGFVAGVDFDRLLLDTPYQAPAAALLSDAGQLYDALTNPAPRSGATRRSPAGIRSTR